MKIAVLGAGSWGTALAKVLAENQQQVFLWGRSEELVNEINSSQQNHKYLPDSLLPDLIQATSSIEEAVIEAKMIIIVVPTSGIREIAHKINDILKKTSKTLPIIVHATKGLENESQLRMSQVIEEEIAEELYQSVVVLSGPSHAEEVAKQDLTTITAASMSLEAAEAVQGVFMNHYFRVYTNTDVIGVELGGALKNIIAVCAGMLSGLGYGDNAKAALITRGLAEISRLGVRLGADPLTFSGLSGVGDLIVTCTSLHSRNFQAGQLLAKNYSRDQVETEIEMVIEGFNTTRVAYQVAKELGIEMPITEMLYRLLYSGEVVSVQDSISELMLRQGKQEASLEQSD